MSKDFRKLIQESVKQKQLHPEDIPSLDLYMDQVIALMSEHLGEDGEKEPLTRTMIHNYSKAGVISPIKGKKYSREQILQMLRQTFFGRHSLVNRLVILYYSQVSGHNY